MANKNLIIGVHYSNSLIGERYNIIKGFTEGLLKGFKNNGVQALTTKECQDQDITPNVTIGFNDTGRKFIEKSLENGIPNISWSIGSPFINGLNLLAKHATNPNFILFNTSHGEADALTKFYPTLKHTNFAQAVDLDVWKKEKCEKEHDAVFMGSIIDIENKLIDLEYMFPKETYDFITELADIWTKSSNSSFWQINELLKQNNGIDLPLEEYILVFNQIADLVSSRKRIQMIQSLKDFDVKVFGKGPWEKYIKGKVQYMGTCDEDESVDVIRKSKVVLHNHPQQTAFGLHERVLNAAAVGSFVISTQNAGIIAEFGKEMDYFEVGYENAPQLLDYYLNNNVDRENKAETASKRVQEYHTWDYRAKQILEIID